VIHHPAPPPDEGPAFTEVIPREGGDRPQAAPDAPDLPPAPPVAPLPLGWLVVKAPLARRGEIIPVRANQIMGREGDVRWDDPRLSRQHARITLEPPPDAPQGAVSFHLWPFGTTNPVFINGQEIRGATALHENDEIRLGDTLFVFKLLQD
jgi:pSer/pThr/pTyr-binding forkhead associated (FHA) protein